jgi:uncharacterized protein (DUF1684 family)
MIKRPTIKLLFLLLCCQCSIVAMGQTFADSVAEFRKGYIKEHLETKHSPIKEANVKNLRFFNPAADYRSMATFTPTPNAETFMIATHSGKQRPYKEYGVLRFKIHDTALVLHVYQSMELINNPQYKDHLFVAFNDLTNYETTYAGGRYIDMTISDIKDNKCILDFNRCYNPYCAYAEGYSCPIPRDENKLKIRINAGEMMYAN